MTHHINKIVIVGGGTAGWISALLLQKALNKATGNTCQITLIEASDIPTVGVGEATVPHLKRAFKFMEIDEAEWMRACNATFKTSIKYVNWSGRPENDVYWHPFERPPSTQEFFPVKEYQISHYWLKKKLLGSDIGRYDESCFTTVAACKKFRSPKNYGAAEYTSDINYAYHLDAGLLAEFLKTKAKSQGVKHVVDRVSEVVLDENGSISHLKTNENGDLKGDLFLDCSGFSGLLINKALHEPFESYSDVLFCDRAVAIQVPTSYDSGQLNPYSTATALSSGWVWDIPLKNRRGTGYVYSSASITPEEAEQEIRKYIGPIADNIEPRHLKMRVGRTRRAWVKNCVSIGLSGGFIEPLESTGIWMITLSLFQLLKNFPAGGHMSDAAEKFNHVINGYYDEIRDFIVMHYCTTNREDTEFWRANKHHPRKAEILAPVTDHWAIRWPQGPRFGPTLFPDYSYFCITAGMDALPENSLPLLNYSNDQEAEAILMNIKQKADQLVRELPSHYDYIMNLHQSKTSA